MKNKAYILEFILAGLVIFFLFSARTSVNQVQGANPTLSPQPQETNCDSKRSIHVTGSALINVTPDRAFLQLGVQSNGVTVGAAQTANTVAIQRVIAAIKSQGVEAKDVSTDLYVIEPIYQDYDALYIKGYRIYNTVAVTVREVNKTSAIVAASLEAGANQVNIVEFYTSELRKYRDQARELAMTAAKEKAQALAMAAGAESGCVLNISENSWSYYNGWRYGSGSISNLWTQNTVQNSTPGSGSDSSNQGDEPISLGQISVKAEVDVTYALK